jgi:hypothetical protein
VHRQSPSSSLSSQETEKPPSLTRFEFIVKSMAQNAIKGPGTSAHHRSMMHIIEMIFDEAVEELTDLQVSDELMSQWIAWFGDLFKWCASGEIAGLPDDMQEMLSSFGTEVPDVSPVIPPTAVTVRSAIE